MSPAARQPALEIAIAWRLHASWSTLRLLERVARHVAAAEGFSTGRLSVAVVGARRMTTLHERYLGLAEPTDVLAFDLGTNRKRGVLDAEVVVCADVARRRSRTTLHRIANQSRRTTAPSVARLLAAARAELALYVTHGLLHLAGYEDHTPAGFRRMHAREDQLLSELGLGPVFDRGKPQHDA